MAINKSSYNHASGTSTVEQFFSGRVIEVQKFTETRNWSDTLDYTDMRSTDCTLALVWLGTHNYAPRAYDGRPMAEYECLRSEASPNGWSKPRDLEFFEQFAWVDCTNLFSDRNGFALSAEVDVTPADGKQPLLWANYHAWKAYCKAQLEATERRLAAERAAEAEAKRVAAEKKAARDSKKAAKEAVLKAAAEAQLVHAPKKGTVATVDGFTGKVIWAGVAKYYGKFNARVGLKDARGEVRWIDASHWAK